MWARVVILVALAACEKRLNPLFCAQNPDDGDCRDAGLVVVDAQVECQTNADCLDPLEMVCEAATHNCAQCVPGGDTTACTGTVGTICGEDRFCHGCIVDTHCTTSAVCLPTGNCAEEADVLYAAPDGTGDCTRSAPCTFTQAVTVLSTTKHIIKLTTTAGTDYTEPPIVLSIPQSVLILGTGTTFIPSADGDAIKVTAGTVEIMGLTITGARGGKSAGVHCMGGELILRRMLITDSAGYGVQSMTCNVTIERTRLSLNSDGGLFLDNGTFEVRNNILDRNGSDTLKDGNARINNGRGRLVFNTIANNNSENGGGDRYSGVDCTTAGGASFLVAHNILVANGPANTAIGGDCSVPANSNYISTSLDSVKFAGIDNYHLTALSPKPQVVEDVDAAIDCKVDGKNMDDFDGQARPYGLCDRGADEYYPAP